MQTLVHFLILPRSRNLGRAARPRTALYFPPELPLAATETATAFSCLDATRRDARSFTANEHGASERATLRARSEEGRKDSTRCGHTVTVCRHFISNHVFGSSFSSLRSKGEAFAAFTKPRLVLCNTSKSRRIGFVLFLILSDRPSGGLMLLVNPRAKCRLR